MPLAPGTRLGPYEILAPIGSGGMGEVYRARDTRLGRTVATKVLPADLSQDPDRRGRFEREAKAIAALNHPHICTLYDVGHHAGIEFLVMELIEGTTLAARLESGPLDIGETLGYAIQMADALDKAHRAGIVHRDLKPSNIMLTKSGVKLLDFGLAKLRADDTPIVAGLTRSGPLTGQGTILGTLHYMAPEQLEGKPIDERADIFAFGAVVFEMITGRRAFDGPSEVNVIGAILHTPVPPIRHLIPVAPPALERLLTICLSKDPEDRWSSAHDLLLQLKGISGPTEGAPAPGGQRSRRRERLAWGVAAVTGLSAIGCAVWLVLRPTPEARTDAGINVLSIVPPAGTTLAPGEAPQISPDGRHVAFLAIDSAGTTALYIRRRDSLAARRLPETEGAALPFWAPDGERMGFFAQGQLQTIALTGGSPRVLAPAPVPRGGTWSRDNVILYSPMPSQTIFRVSASGGEAKPVPQPEGLLEARWFPVFLPDGRHYLHLTVSLPSFTGRSIHVATLDSPDTKELVRSKAAATYASPGYLMFWRDGTLVAQPFDARTLQLSGTGRVVAENVGFNAITYQTLFSVADDGVLAYADSTPGTELAWFDRQGKRIGAAVPPGKYHTLCLTPDDKRVVYESADPASGNVDIWSLEVAGGVPSKLTFDATVDFYPVCSPTGTDVIFATLREGQPNLFRAILTAPGSEKAVLRSAFPKIPTDWSRDDKVVFSVHNRKTNWDIGIVPASGGEVTLFGVTEFEERNARLSPDGRWMAYVSNQDGAFNVYVQPFPSTGAKWQVSRGGGRQPQWRRDGAELYYIGPDNSLIGVETKRQGSSFVLGAARTLMVTHITGMEPVSQGCQYAATADGQRFLVSTATGAVLPIQLVLNWQAALGR